MSVREQTQEELISHQDRRKAGWLTVMANRRELLLFVLLLFSFSYFFPRWASWGQNSRMDLVMAVVDKGTLSIDDYHENTGDVALLEGHYYSEKSIGPSLLAMPFYKVFKILVSLPPMAELMTRVASNEALQNTLLEEGAGLTSDKLYFAMALTFVTFFVITIPSAILALLFYRFLGDFLPDERQRLFLTLAFALCTMAFPYSNMFFQHQLSSSALFCAFYMLYKMRQTLLSWRWLWVVGLLFSLALISEYSTVLIAAVLFIYAIYFLPDKRQLFWIFVGGAPLILVMAAYNYAIFRTPLPMGYLYDPNYIEWHHTGLVTVTYPKLNVLWNITFSPFRGLFFLSPFLLLAAPGFIYFWQVKKYWPEFFVSLVNVLSFLMFNASSVVWWGGYAVGPRYLIPMLPYLTFPIGFFLAKAWRAIWARVLTYALVIASSLVVWIETISGQSFPDFTPNPLFDYSLPRFLSGDIARNVGMVLGLSRWNSLLPLAIFLAAMVFLLLRNASVRQSRESFEVLER